MNIDNKNIEKKIKSLLNLFKTSNFNLVISKTKKIIKEFPDYLILYNILGSAYQNVGAYGLAKNIFTKALQMDPGNVAVMNNLANTYKNLGEFKSAEGLFIKIINKKPNYINAYINYGNLKKDINDFKLAIELYTKALNINDKVPLVFYSLALAHQSMGNFDLAINYAQKALLLEPKFTQADMLISQSTEYKSEDTHYIKMTEKIDKPELNTDQKINLQFALAKASEDIGNIDLSFKYLEQGNKIKRQSINFEIKNEIKLFDSIKETFKGIDLNKFTNGNSGRRNIIFILGMPRSGTTLTEQIISSHSNVFGAGELPQLSKIIQHEFMEKDIMTSHKIIDLINNPQLINDLRANYYEYLSKFNYNENYVTDKAPLNFRWIGLIKILFPDSKIIHCSRNPKDNCLSLYKNLFEGGLNFSYDQKELGTYYNLYLDLMQFWKEIIPTSFHEVKYETIIENQKEESKKIIKFCNLDWESNCLSFYKNKTPIKTMSTAQARKPIYKSSLNSHKKYSSFLKTLNNIIEI